MTNDPEIAAMTTLTEALAPLGPDAVARVLTWALDRYQIAPRKGAAKPPAPTRGDLDRDNETPVFNDVASLYDAAGPSGEPRKALVVAYWLQQIQGQADFESQQVNTHLKHLGHGVGNITRALAALMETRPRLVIQTHKGGKSRQARKKFKLTTEGIRAVERMLSGEPDEE